jgi:hypothetical protein
MLTASMIVAVPLDYHTPARSDAKPRRSVVVNIIVASVLGAALLALIVYALTPNLSRSSETANRVKCMRNLKEIGAAIQQYANVNAGQLPPSLLALAIDRKVPWAAFVCPSSNAELLHLATTPVVSERLPLFETTHQHRSYDYALSKGATASLSSLQWDDVLLVELLDNHDNKGVYALFADGSVDWVNNDRRGKAKQLLADLKSGVWPLRVK